MARQGFTVFWTQEEIGAGAVNLMNHLRSKKQFSKVVKDGIALVWDLMNGHTDELLRQFPFVQEAICQRTPPTSGNDDILKELGEIRLLIQDRPAADGNPSQTGAPRKIASAIDISMPLIDANDDDTLTFTQQTGGGNINAMMQTTMKLMYGKTAD